MKFKLLFIAAILVIGGVRGQVSGTEVISSESSYLPFQDSLLILRTVTVSTTELEGVNDTLVSYSEPIDSAGLARQLTNAYLNDVNTKAARLRNANPMRFFLRDYADSKALVAQLGQNLDSLLVAQYKRQYLGTWRVFLANGQTYNAEIIEHPTNAGLLRLTGGQGQSNANVTVYGRYLIRAVLQGKSEFLNWDGGSQDRPAFVPLTNALPAAAAAINTTRMVKIR